MSGIEASADVVLILDDNSQLVKFMTVIINTTRDIEKECSGKMPIFEDKNFRAVFFDYYKQKNRISNVIGTFQKDITGYTTKRSFEEKEKQKKKMNIIGIKFKERQICVSQKDCIKSTQLVYHEAEEVI